MFGFLKKDSPLKPEVYDETRVRTHFDSTHRQSLSTLELARLTLSDTMQRNGIPKDWIRVECFEVAHRPGLKETHMQLFIERWSEQLLHYSAALQQQFVAGLNHFEPGVDHSNIVISWRFAADCAMPSALIPEGIAWHVSAHRSD